MVIRRVVLDAFGTVFSPRTPVFAQYTAVAREFGLTVEEQRVKESFKSAFKHWAKEHPLYGKRSSPPLDAAGWWAGVIQDTFHNAGVKEADFDAVRYRLSETLINRFWGSEGYALHSDVLPFLSALSKLPSPSSSSGFFPPPAVASNTDSSVSRVLRSLGVLIGQAEGGIRDGEVWTTYELEEDKTTKAFWEEVLEELRETTEGEQLEPGEVLVVGDELQSDYLAPRLIGMRSLLLLRSADAAHPNPRYEDERDGRGKEAETVRSLGEVVEWIKRENGST